MRGGWLVLSVIVGVLALLTGRALGDAPAAKADEHKAAEKGPEAGADHGKKDEHAKSGDHGKEGAGDHKEPSLFDGALDQTIWTVVVFLLLLLILWKFAWGPLLQGLQKREDAIQAAADQAKKDRDDAARLRQEFDQKLSQGADQVRQMLDEARKDAQHAHDQMMADARAEIQTEKDRLRREIETARDQALKDLLNRSADLAASLSTVALGRNVSADDHRRLVDEAIAGLGEAGAEWRRTRTAARA